MKKLLISFLLCASSCSLYAGNVLTPKGYVSDNKISVGDKIVSVNGGINTVLKIEKMQPDFYISRHRAFSYYLINHKYKFFQDQSIFYNRDAVKHTFEFKKGDSIFLTEYKVVKITSIEIVQGEREWIRFTISGDHSYIEDGILVHNAARFWIGQSGGGNYNTTLWSTTSGGAGGSATPTSSDDVTFDGAGTFGNTNCTITVSATAQAKTVTFTGGYTATLTINTNITWTISGSFTDNTAHTWTMGNSVSGIIITGTATITSGGKTFPGAVSLQGSSVTKTLSGDWTVSGSVTVPSGNTQVINSNTLNISGTMTVTAGCSGTTLINLISGGTLAGASVTGLSNNLTFAGNSTFNYTGNYNTGTITYSSGTITTSASLTISGSCTLNTNGMSWSSIIIANNPTVTINSLLTISGSLILNAGSAPTFTGSSGWTVGTLTLNITDTRTISLKNGVTYTITTSFQAYQARTGNLPLFTSDDGTIKAILTLQQGAICSVLADFTRIDASAGRTINTFHGTLTSTNNIFSYTDYNGGVSSSCLFIQ